MYYATRQTAGWKIGDKNMLNIRRQCSDRFIITNKQNVRYIECQAYIHTYAIQMYISFIFQKSWSIHIY